MDFHLHCCSFISCWQFLKKKKKKKVCMQRSVCVFVMSAELAKETVQHEREWPKQHHTYNGVNSVWWGCWISWSHVVCMWLLPPLWSDFLNSPAMLLSGVHSMGALGLWFNFWWDLIYIPDIYIPLSVVDIRWQIKHSRQKIEPLFLNPPETK